MTEFGSGPTLRQSCRYLRDDDECHRRILDVTERNSVIEGLPPFTVEGRRLLMGELKAMDSTQHDQVLPR
jgi:hypothetical protein